MPLTLKDLAKELKVTEATVSLALRNHPRISPETRQQVQALAAKLGYIVNPAFSRRGSTRMGKRGRPIMPLALILQRNPSYSHGSEAYQIEIKRIAANFGYVVTLHLLKKDECARRLGDILKNRGVEAVLCGPIYYKSILDDFPWGDFCIGACEAGLYAPPCHLVMPDVGQAILAARQLCVARGYHRIGFAQIIEPTPPVDYLDRYGAASLAATTCPDAVSFTSGDFSARDRTQFLGWVKAGAFDIVIGQTATFYWWLREGGYNIPQDIGFIGLRMDADRTERELSGFEEDHLLTASLACQLVDMEVRQFRRGPPKAPARMLVKMPWYEGRTLRPQAVD
ncbi:MAG: LacI family DNA-binding transcriptional regulator [Verrucomicrobiota bacterium]|nr:LacI family DNA-binding transcriptional regulator [Verrucomicrobiota bacterium]